MNTRKLIFPILLTLCLTSCNSGDNELALQKNNAAAADTVKKEDSKDFTYVAEQFADLRVLRYKIEDFDQLSLQQKELLYYLYEAALCGRDITWDQNYKYNLTIRKLLEAIVSDETNDLNNPEYQKFLVYAKRVWFSSGIHHHYSSDKFVPECSKEFFTELVHKVEPAKLPLINGESIDNFISFITPIIFDPSISAKKVELDPAKDLVTASAVNFYEGVNQKEVTAFYEKQIDKKSKTPVMTGLNSKIVKENGKIVEKKWMVGGMYTAAIEKIVYWLEKASSVAENPAQKDALDKLVTYYKTGDLKDFDAYCIAWVKDTESAIDVVNGFIEVYQDPLGRKGSFEAVVSVKDMEASKRIAAIGANAKSSNFYLSLKGSMEEAIHALPYTSLHIFRPSLLLGSREGKRKGEKLAQSIMPALSFMLAGSLKKYRAIEASDVAKAMLAAAKSGKWGINVYEHAQMKTLQASVKTDTTPK